MPGADFEGKIATYTTLANFRLVPILKDLEIGNECTYLRMQ
jgi:hypothetical protein